ncbi:hypothetical protein MHU86_13255 [Fragilaria crotonensis]|nr:hypothetical protein MHU86_13255 [Fragilaria crotonensis]
MFEIEDTGQQVIDDSGLSDNFSEMAHVVDDRDFQVNTSIHVGTVGISTNTRMQVMYQTQARRPHRALTGMKKVLLVYAIGGLGLINMMISPGNNFSNLTQVKSGSLNLKHQLKHQLKQRIVEASQYMSPPFDTLLADDASHLFERIMRNWNETMDLVDSKKDVFTRLILQGVGTKVQILSRAIKEWEKFRDSNNSTIHYVPGAARARLLFAERNDEPTVYALSFNENWGYFSTAFNYPYARSASWSVVKRHPRWKVLITDNPNISAVFSVQHHNFSDPELDNKVLSLPIGGDVLGAVWDKLVSRPPDMLRDKDYDITLIGRQKFRVRTFCSFINSKRFPHPAREPGKLGRDEYITTLSTTRYIWTPPGMGYDCHRNWDALLAGAIPIMERGFGLERTYAYLPVFWIDTFDNLTPEKLAYAYPLFAALRNEFDFSRLQKKYWKSLMMNVFKEKSDDLLRVKHPFPKQRVIWPVVPPNGTIEDFGRVHGPGFFRQCNTTFANVT